MAPIAALEAAASLHPWSPDAVSQALQAPACLGWVAWEGSAARGHLLAQAVAGEGEIHTLGVDPSARRRGIASALLAACERAWRAHEVQAAWLEVAADNPGARALYAGRGWREAGLRTDYYGPGQDAVVMAWSP